MKVAVVVVLVVSAAALAAGCGGGSAGSSSSTVPGGVGPGGGAAPKKATAPNAPAGSKVVSCGTGAAGMTQLRATAVACGAARTTMRSWAGSRSCALAEGASRGSCSLGGFRCQAVRVDRGAAVSCVRQGGDVSFVARARSFR